MNDMATRLQHPLSFLWLYILWHCSTDAQGAQIRNIPELPTVNFSRPGNLTLGVVMSLHSYDEDVLCGNVIRELGALQRLEAIVFAVDEINKRDDLLPNVTLGFTILDDCYNDLTALIRSLQFIQTMDNSSATVPEAQASLPAVSAVAVIGAEGSPRTLQMADMFSVFHVPLLSYASSSPLLDDKTKYPYFSRIVPSDSMQAKAIVDILLTYGWTYVSILYADGSYGQEGFWAIQNHLESLDYCLAVTQMIKNSFRDKDYEAAIDKLMTKPQAHVVVLFTTQAQALRLFKVLDRRQLHDQFTFVGGDSIGMNPHIFDGLERVVDGTISVNFVSAPVDRFEQHFRHMTLRNGSRNPWFGTFISAIFNCSLNTTDVDACDEDKQIVESDAYKPESTASLSMNAVYAYAHALEAVMKNCSAASASQCVEPYHLLLALRSVHFEGENVTISFDATGSGETSYDIRNFVLESGKLVQKRVGVWNTATSNFSFFFKDEIRWKPNLISPTAGQKFAYPESVCARPCPVGQQAVVTQPSCCFYCESCRENERTVTRTSSNGNGLPKCEQCPTGDNFTWPDDESKTECLPLSATYLHIAELEGILLVSLDVLVFVMTCVTTFFYVKNGETRLIKASSQELSIMMLAGHFLSCFLVVTFVLEPSSATCIITSAGFHLSFTLSYAPLLVKTNRIFRIFVSGKKSTKRPPFVTSRSQVAFAAIIISLQFLLICISVAVDPQQAHTVMPNLSVRQVFRECSVPEAGFLASISFNILLMALCAGHAFKTRSLPANFNEAKFITFSIYTTILLWLSFFPSYFTAKNYMVKALCLAIALLFNVLSCQVFIFLPKLYAVYFLSEDKMNLRDNLRSTVGPVDPSDRFGRPVIGPRISSDLN